VLFFGLAKDISKIGSAELELNNNSTVLILLQKLKYRYSGFASINDFSVAVNEEYVEKEIILKENDVVAIIPPVSGG
jgi:molybdopterin converting factor subunit 1